MKVNSLLRMIHTADYYDYRVEVDNALNQEFVYFFDRNIKIRVFNDNSSRLMIYSPEVLKINTRISNIKDVNGQFIVPSSTMDQGFTFTISSVDPVMNAFGSTDYLRYVAVRA